MNSKYKIIKPILIIILCLMFLPYVLVRAENNRVLITAKNQSGVKHFSSNTFVEIPMEYDNAYAEMRGVWVATVYNIAISKQDGTSEKAIMDYQNEFIKILNRMEQFGMNTIFFQVRPSNDAFYVSNLNPWSEFLVGRGINPGWDPLEWMIEQTHNRGFRFMCWMNAFRVTTESYVHNGSAQTLPVEELVKMKHKTLSTLAEGNFAKEHPEYVIAGSMDEKLILNPSEPAVQKFIVDTIMEIVENYDVDGLHFDDYFYLEGTTSSNTENTNFVGKNTYITSGADIMNDLPNYYTYQEDPKNYGKDVFGETGIYGMEEGLNLGDFRRENINIMMRNIRLAMDKYNQKTGKCVEFGSKPAAVWRSNSEYCTPGSSRCSEIGSNTHEYAYSTYSDLYADSLKWVEEGLVDWVAPQIYYSFEDLYAPYADVVDWWAAQVERINLKRRLENKKDIRLYIAHGIYKYRDNPDQFYRSAEITDQIRYNKHYDCIRGSAVYSYEIMYQLLGNDITSQYPNAENIRFNAMNMFKNLWTNNKVFPLEIGIDDSEKLNDISYTLKEMQNKNLILNFNTIQNAVAYGLYKIPKEEPFDKNKISYRLDILYAGYEENKKLTMDLGILDENYNYYLLPVSTNGYTKDNAILIDLDTRNPNLAPTATTLEILDYQKEVKIGSDITVVFTLPEDPNGDEVFFDIKLIENGIERTIQPTVKQVDNQIKFVWKSYLYESKNCKFKVLFSDGELITSVESVSFDLVSHFTPSVGKILLDKTVYYGYEMIQVSYDPIFDVEGLPLTYEVNLVIDNKKYDITEVFENANNYQFSLTLPNLSSSKCYIEIIVNNGYQVAKSTSDFFIINENQKPVGGRIILDKTILTSGENLKGSFVLPTDEELLSYKFYLVIDNVKQEIILPKDTYNFDIEIPPVEIISGYVEIVVSDSYYEVTLQSDTFTIQDEEVFDDAKKNCKSCKNHTALYLITLLSNFTIGIYLLAKHKKY